MVRSWLATALLGVACADFTVLSPAHRAIRHTNAQFGFGRSVGGEVKGTLVFGGLGCEDDGGGGGLGGFGGAFGDEGGEGGGGGSVK